MDLSNTALDLIGTLPSNILIVYAWTRVLRMRSNVLFWIVSLVLVTAVVAGRNEAGFLTRLALTFAGYGALPFAFSSEKPARKLIVIAFVNAIVIVAELVSIAGWYVMTGLDIMDYDAVRGHLGAYAFTHAIHLVILAALFWGLRRVLERYDDVEAFGSRGFAWFPLVQAVLLGLALSCGVYANRGSETLFFGMTALSLVCLAADAALFASMGRYARKRCEDQRAALLERRLDGCLERCSAFVAEVERTSWFRHDVRNQAHTAIALAQRGDFERAREHLSSFRTRLESER